MAEKLASRFGFYQGLVELASEHKDLMVLDADLAKTTGSFAFEKAYPDQFVDVGIAEQNMVGFAAGLARVGFVPFCGSMAVFAAGRGFELIRNAVAYSSINMKIVGSHGGITAAGDGGSHQCIEDIAIMRALPNMVVLSPCDSEQAKKLAKLMYATKGPMYVRTSREPVEAVTTTDDDIVLGKAQKLRSGEDLCIISTGMMTVLAAQAVEILAKRGIHAALLNIHTIKPLDEYGIRDEVAKCGGKVLVCEEANDVGGLGDAVARALVEQPTNFGFVSVHDRFGQSGATGELLEAYGITTSNIVAKAMDVVRRGKK